MKHRIPYILVILLYTTIYTISYGQDNVISSKLYKLTFSPVNGTLISFVRNEREYISKVAGSEPLFFIRLRDEKGKAKNLMAYDNKGFSIMRSKTDLETIIELQYKSVGHLPVDAIVTVKCPKNSALTYWSIQIDNQTSEYIEHIDFPTLIVPNDLVGMNGDSRIFRPSMEGALIEDIDLRQNTWLSAQPLEYPHTGWSGYYPGSCSMQFMAYYNKNGGLYLAAHDKDSHLKGMEVYKHKVGGIVIKYRIFPGGAGKGLYTLPFDMVLGGFDGNWYDAADIYRNWFESAKMLNIPKLKENKHLPEWFGQSPIVLVYPVRGSQDMGEMKPNEYYPYSKALPYLDSLAKQMDSKIMAMLMHWEGTAPWAPPYMWPPYGGEEKLHAFVKAMHAQGNLVGLYGSGMAYTLKSKIDTSYNKTKEFHDLHLKNVMNIAPDGDLATNGMGTGTNNQDFRTGYDMCPATQFAKNVIHAELSKILLSGIDYMQLFDQNAGGNGYFCYSKHHGHPHIPGNWLNHEMIKNYQVLQHMIGAAGHKMLLGCEGAAAEPFIPYLPINELRYNFNYMQGKPVPAYSYVFHEYVNNYMGNQSSVESGIDILKSPMNLHQRIAYAFLSGDMMALTLADKANFTWGWGTDWKTPRPNQYQILHLIRLLNAWRKGAAKDFLIYGRMEKPFEIKGGFEVPVITPSGKLTRFNSVFTTKWKSQDGRKVQIIVNYTDKGQMVNIVCPPDSKIKKVKVIDQNTGEGRPATVESDGSVVLQINALSVVMVEF